MMAATTASLGGAFVTRTVIAYDWQRDPSVYLECLSPVSQREPFTAISPARRRGDPGHAPDRADRQRPGACQDRFCLPVPRPRRRDLGVSKPTLTVSIR